jgi:hypothetical protein
MFYYNLPLPTEKVVEGRYLVSRDRIKVTCIHDFQMGFPKVDYKGVNDAIGPPSSVDCVSPTVLGILAGIVDGNGGIV